MCVVRNIKIYKCFQKFIKVCAEQTRSSDWNVSVLADRWVQRWKFSANGNETYLFEDFEIFRKIRDAFHQKLWSNRGFNCKLI